MALEPAPPHVVDRLLSKIDVDSNGCWISRYSTGSHGYSQVGWSIQSTSGLRKITMRLGHRVSWEAVRGPIPDGMTIDHLCKTRRCINPEHLRLLSNKENATDNGQHSAGPPKPMGKKCGKGLHELLRYPSGAIACRECMNDRNRKKDVKSTICPVCNKALATRGGWRGHLRKIHNLRPADFTASQTTHQGEVISE